MTKAERLRREKNLRRKVFLAERHWRLTHLYADPPEQMRAAQERVDLARAELARHLNPAASEY